MILSLERNFSHRQTGSVTGNSAAIIFLPVEPPFSFILGWNVLFIVFPLKFLPFTRQQWWRSKLQRAYIQSSMKRHRVLKCIYNSHRVSITIYSRFFRANMCKNSVYGGRFEIFCLKLATSLALIWLGSLKMLQLFSNQEANPFCFPEPSKQVACFCCDIEGIASGWSSNSLFEKEWSSEIEHTLSRRV